MTFNEQVNLLDEIILRVLHAAFKKIGPFLEKISSLSQAIFESPRSTSLIRMKCAEMKGIFLMRPYLLETREIIYFILAEVPGVAQDQK